MDKEARLKLENWSRERLLKVASDRKIPKPEGFKVGEGSFRFLKPAIHWLVYDEKMRAVFVCFEQEDAKAVRDQYYPAGMTGYSWVHEWNRPVMYDWGYTPKSLMEG